MFSVGNSPNMISVVVRGNNDFLDFKYIVVRDDKKMRGIIDQTNCEGFL